MAENKISLLLQTYRKQCKLALQLYDFLQQYNGYYVNVQLNKYNGDALCYGEVKQFKTYVTIDRDFFTTYPSLTHDWEGDDCLLVDLEFPEKDIVKIIREDGVITVEGILNDYRAETKNTVDICPKDILQYAQREFVDEIWSKKINGDQYYVIDFFRAKHHNADLIRCINILLKTQKYANVTKTMFIRKVKGDTEQYEVGLWDILNECPVSQE